MWTVGGYTRIKGYGRHGRREHVVLPRCALSYLEGFKLLMVSQWNRVHMFINPLISSSYKVNIWSLSSACCITKLLSRKLSYFLHQTDILVRHCCKGMVNQWRLYMTYGCLTSFSPLYNSWLYPCNITETCPLSDINENGSNSAWELFEDVQIANDNDVMQESGGMYPPWVFQVHPYSRAQKFLDGK